MQLTPNEAHIWSTLLLLTPEEIQQKRALLSPDEWQRAERLHSPLHRQRFIAARAALRQIIGFYVNLPPAEIVFDYRNQRKPGLQHPANTPLQFNLSHSHEMAVYAFALNHPLGIDIEKMRKINQSGLAKRFFSPQENHDLNQLADHEKTTGFFRLWARKEALIKATGQGLAMSLSSFSVSVQNKPEIITLDHHRWSLLPLAIHDDYQAALAIHAPIQSLTYWHFVNDQYSLDQTTML